jgi:hypothetical protein
MDPTRTTPRVIFRTLLGTAVAALLLGRATAAHTRELTPCGAGATSGATAPGWRVQVDPDTGIYSMPSPATSTAPVEGEDRRGADLVVTPGTSPAGGYKIRLGDSAASHQEQK